MKSNLFWTFLFLRLQTYVSSIGAALFIAADVFLIGHGEHSFGGLTFLAVIALTVAGISVWARAGLQVESRKASIAAAILCGLGLGSLLFFIAIPALLQIVRHLSKEPLVSDQLPDCPICAKQLLMVRRMGKTQLCECGWFAPITEIKFLHKPASQRGGRWSAMIIGPAAAFVLIVVAAALIRILTLTPAPEIEVVENSRSTESARTKPPIATRPKSKVGRSLDELRKIGARCNTDGDFKCSQEAYIAILEKLPRDISALANLGFAEHHLGNHATAIVLLRTVIESGHPAYDTLAYYGMSLEALGKDDQALKAYLQTLDISERLVDVRRKAIALLIQMNRLDEADRLLTAYTKKYPTARGYFRAQEQLIRERLNNVSHQADDQDAGTI